MTTFRDEDDNLIAAGGWIAALRPRAPINVLLLAKEPSFRKLLGDALDQRGHLLHAVADPAEAIARVTHSRFDVALLLLPPTGAAPLQLQIRELDPDLEVVWMPPPLSVVQAEILIREAADRGRRRMANLCLAARALLEPLSPDTAAARLIEQTEELLGAQAALVPAEPSEPQQVLVSPDRHRLRVPLWEGGPPPDSSASTPGASGTEEDEDDTGYRLEIARDPDAPEFSRGELERATVLGSLGSLALTRAHCEQALAELYRDGLEDARADPAALAVQRMERSSVRAEDIPDHGGLPAGAGSLGEDAERGLSASAIGPLERLAGVLAHELNNPLTFVLANLSCLKDEIGRLQDMLRELPERHAGPVQLKARELSEVLAEVLGGASRVREVVADLTTLGTREEGAARPVRVDEVVRAALRIARREVQRRAQVVVDLEPRLPPVVGSASRLGQVVLNLLLNAVQAVPHGDTGRHEVRIQARSQPSTGEVVISISDTGRGIAEDMLPRVFEAGYTTKPGGHGSGLGLAISREIVRAHGGEIYIESQAGRGTTVSVVLPVQQDGQHGEPSGLH